MMVLLVSISTPGVLVLVLVDGAALATLVGAVGWWISMSGSFSSTGIIGEEWLYTSRDLARFCWNLAISSVYNSGLLKKKFGTVHEITLSLIYELLFK